MRYLVKHFEKIVMILTGVAFSAWFLFAATQGLYVLWPQIIMVLSICWMEIHFLGKRVKLYKELNVLHKEHINYLIKQVHIRELILMKIIAETDWLEQKTPPPV
jgi:hypothetical protein